jgi:hypothetical protein
MTIPSNPLVPEVADVAASAVSDVKNVAYEECDYVLCFNYMPHGEQICQGCNRRFLLWVFVVLQYLSYII